MNSRKKSQLRSPPVRVTRAGFYTYRERVLGSALVPATTTRCAAVEETALAAPKIVTGKGDLGRYVRAPGVGALTENMPSSWPTQKE